MNAISVRLLGLLSVVSVGFHVVGTLVIVIGLPIIATTRQSASWVFGHFQVKQPVYWATASLYQPLACMFLWQALCSLLFQ